MADTEATALVRQLRDALRHIDAALDPDDWAGEQRMLDITRPAIATADEWLSRQRGPLADAVINAARLAMDESFEAGNEERDIAVPAHLAASLSLCLDEYDRAHGISLSAGEDKPC